jgi:hypothetical protein
LYRSKQLLIKTVLINSLPSSSFLSFLSSPASFDSSSSLTSSLIPRAPSPVSGCASPIAEKEANFESDGLTQSQKWPVGFGPSGEIVVWDQGVEDWVGEGGDSPCHPDLSLDWMSDGVGDEDPSFVILDAIEEDFHRGKKGSLKIKGKRDVLNLKSSIEYSDASVPSRRRK